ncbi:MAG: phosphodiesterase [Pseudomonadota bacterium]
MKFVHITDPHLVPPGELLWGLDTFERLDACLADIAEFHGDAEFCFISGDLTDRGDAAAYQGLRQRLEAFPIPVYLTLGNHDERESYFSAFPNAPDDGNGFAQQIADTSAGRFILMDTLGEPGSSEGRYCAARMAWLKGQLAGAGGDIYIVMHHPPLDIGVPYMDRIKLREHDEFAGLAAGDARIRHIFFGHVHRMVFGTWNGIAYSALPGLSHQVPLVRGSVAHNYSQEPPMYAVVTLVENQITINADGFWDRGELPDPPKRKS